MTPTQAQEIVDLLARGVDPGTGEILAVSSPLNSPDVVRALFIAADALKTIAVKPTRARPRAAPGNAGKLWTEEENLRLVAAFDAGTPVAALAHSHERTHGAIRSRLIRLGKIDVEHKDPIS